MFSPCYFHVTISIGIVGSISRTRSVKLRQKKVTKQNKPHKTQPGLEPWTIGTVDSGLTTVSYPLPLLFYLINATHVVVSLYIHYRCIRRT